MAYLGRQGVTAPLTSADIPDSSITTAKLVDSSVNSAKIGVDVIVAEDIANNAVTVAELADNAVTTAKINADAVTGAKLANDIAITTTGALTGTTGDFNWDSNTLVVDSSESNVGIGTTTPGLRILSGGAANLIPLLEIAGTEASENTSSPMMVFRNTSTAIHATQDYRLGTIAFAGNDISGSESGIGAEIMARADTTWTGSTNVYPTALTFSTTDNASNAITERMRITSSGKVGINEASPYHTCHITADNTVASLVVEASAPSTTAPSRIVFATSGTPGYYNAGIGGIRDVVDNGSGSLVFYTGGANVSTHANLSERMRIDTSGNIGIGDSSPACALVIKGPAEAYNNPTEVIRFERNAADIRYNSIFTQCSATAANAWIQFRVHDGGGSPHTAQTTVMTLDGNGRVGIGETAPAAALDVGEGAILIGGSGGQNNSYTNHGKICRSAFTVSPNTATGLAGGYFGNLVMIKCNSDAGNIQSNMVVSSGWNVATVLHTNNYGSGHTMTFGTAPGTLTVTHNHATAIRMGCFIIMNGGAD